jgi:hypothetical protein
MLGVIVVQKPVGASGPRLLDGGSGVGLDGAGVAPCKAAAEPVPVAAHCQVFGQVPGDINHQPTADVGHAAGGNHLNGLKSTQPSSPRTHTSRSFPLMFRPTRTCLASWTAVALITSPDWPGRRKTWIKPPLCR